MPSPAVAPFVERRNRISAALGRLSAARSTEVIRATAPRELVEARGFTRAMISAVRGSRWVPLKLHTRHDVDPRSAEFLAYVESDAEIPLANMLAETDVVRRRTALLVDEYLVGTRAFKPIIEVARSSAYVVAPILVEGRTIGFMHADRVGQGRPVDEDDRRCIQAFTAELAVVYQCASWSERVSERSRRALSELERAAEALRLIDSPVAELPVVADRAPAVRPDPRAGGVVREERFLTAREYEVLEHVADGATNRVIAQRLSVSEDTVKTHMRGVLRKLRSRRALPARPCRAQHRPARRGPAKVGGRPRRGHHLHLPLGGNRESRPGATSPLVREVLRTFVDSSGGDRPNLSDTFNRARPVGGWRPVSRRHRNSLWLLLTFRLCLSFFSGRTVEIARRGAHRDFFEDSRSARVDPSSVERTNT